MPVICNWHRWDGATTIRLLCEELDMEKGLEKWADAADLIFW